MPDLPRQPSAAEDGVIQLASELVNPASQSIDRMSALDITRLMNAEDATVARAVERELARIARAIEAISARLRAGGRLIYIGAGTSGRLGALDAVECPPTFNVSPERVVGRIAGGTFAWTAAVEDAEDRADLGAADIAELQVRAEDAVVGIAASGRTPYVLGALDAARATGALTVGLACNANTPLERAVDIMIAPVVGPEVIAGSTRLKAGTAQKMVLNMLSTGVMVLLGKTYGNLMVDVQATNAKLRARALAIVASATGVDAGAAETLLTAAGGEVKTAIVMGLIKSSPEEARTRLAAHGGVLRTALEAGAQ
jgi:N-acetylmuramic acid 6-phosphate etherase